MNRHVFAVAGGCVLAFALVGSLAWAAGPVAVDIPFRFAVADREMPAGHYQLEPSGAGPSKLVVKGSDGGVAIVPVIERLADTGGKEPTAVFDEKAGKFFLSELHVPGQDGLLVGIVKGEQAHKVVIGTEK